MIKAITFFLALSLLNMTFLAAQENEKEKNRVNREVKKIMEMMVIHQYGLYQMADNDLYLSKDFKKASNEIIKYSTKMKDIKHPEEKFRKANKEMLKELIFFKAALASGKKDKIKTGWKRLSQACIDCHSLYNLAK